MQQVLVMSNGEGRYVLSSKETKRLRERLRERERERETKENQAKRLSSQHKPMATVCRSPERVSNRLPML